MVSDIFYLAQTTFYPQFPSFNYNSKRFDNVLPSFVEPRKANPYEKTNIWITILIWFDGVLAEYTSKHQLPGCR